MFPFYVQNSYLYAVHDQLFSLLIYVNCTLLNVQHVHCTIYTAQCTLYNVLYICRLCTVQYKLYTAQFNQHTVLCKL